MVIKLSVINLINKAYSILERKIYMTVDKRCNKINTRYKKVMRQVLPQITF